MTSVHRSIPDVSFLDNAEWFRTLVEESPVMICIHREGRIIYVNPAGVAAFGARSFDELEGRLLTDFSAPEEVPDVVQRLRSVEQGNTPPSRVARLKRLNGDFFYADVLSMPVTVGGTACVQTIAVDATERFAVQRALERSEQTHRSLFENNPDAACSLDLSGAFTGANAAAEKMTGYSAGELAGMTFGPLIVPEDKRRAQSYFRRAVRGLPQYYQLGLMHRDGRRVEIRGAKLPIMVDGRVTGIFVVAHDITEALATQRALEQSRQVITTSFNASPNAVAIVRWRDECVLEANPIWCETIGRVRDDVVGRSLTELEFWAEPADRERFLETIKREGRVREYSIRMRRRGLTSPRETRFSADMIDLGGEQCILAVGRDETDERLMEAQLRQAQKMDAIGQLAGGVAHDFNNLLTVIRSSAELALSDLAEGEPVREDLSAILAASDRAAALTRQLLAFSRKQMMSVMPMDVNDVIEHTGDMLRRLLGRGIVLKLEPGEIPMVSGDRGQLEQVVVNLVVNARDAITQGGVITLATATEHIAGPIHDPRAPFVPTGDYVRLTVTDNGCGMSSEVASRVFEPFFTTKPSGQGTGLGMATVYGIVKQLGGFVWIESELGVGTSVHVLLPAGVEA